MLTNGPALVQYLADLPPQAGLAPPNATLECTRQQDWLNFITSEINAGSSPLFNRDLPETVRDMFQTRSSQRLNLLDAELTSRSYIMGGSFTVADAYLYTVLNWMEALGVELARWHHRLAYFTRIPARPPVLAALAREAEISPVTWCQSLRGWAAGKQFRRGWISETLPTHDDSKRNIFTRVELTQ